MGNSKYSGRYREKAAGASLCGRHMEPLPEPWVEPSAAVYGPRMREISCRHAGRGSCRLIRRDLHPVSKVSLTGFSRDRERYRASALYCERGSFRIQVVPRTYTFALSLSDCRIPAKSFLWEPSGDGIPKGFRQARGFFISGWGARGGPVETAASCVCPGVRQSVACSPMKQKKGKTS